MDESVSWLHAIEFAVGLGALLIAGAWTLGLYVLGRIDKSSEKFSGMLSKTAASIELVRADSEKALEATRLALVAELQRAIEARDTHARDIFADRVSVARLDARLDGMAATLSDVHAMLRTFTAERAS